VNRFFLAGLSASLPHVVSRDELVMANSVSTTTGTVVAITGGGIGFALKKLLGEGSTADAEVIVVAALVYALAAGLAARMDRDLLGPDLDNEPPQTRAAVRRVARGLVDGAQHVWHHRSAGHALAAIGAHRFFYGVSTITAILLFRSYFNDPDDVDAGLAGLAKVFAASGFGFFLAAVVTPEATTRVRKQTWIVICFSLAAVVEAVFVVVLTEWLLYVGAFVLGVAAQGSKICVDTIVQTSVDDAYRGRVFSFYDVIFNIAFVSAAAFGAVALPTDGNSRAVYAVVAVGYAVTAVGYARATKHLTGLAPCDPRREAQGGCWVDHQRRSSASASSGESGPCSRRTSLRCCQALPTSGPGGTPRIAMIALPSRSGRIDSSSSCSRSRSIRCSRSS
jgi:hypothetical protein